MNVRRLIPGTAVAATALLGLGALSGCSSSDAAGGSDGKLDVTASFYPMQYLAEEIGGGHVEVTTLTEPGQEPHDLEISARQTAAMEESDLVLYLKGLQPAVDEAVQQSEARTKVDATTLTSLEKDGPEPGESAGSEKSAGSGEPSKSAEPSKSGEPAGEHADEHGHAEDGHGHAEEGHAEDGHGHGEEEKPAGEEEAAEEEAGHDGHDHGHSHDGPDPHIWLDPVRYAEVAKGLGKAMAKADPDHAADYGKNTDALVKRLDALHTKFEGGLRDTRTDVFITTHSAFGYLADRYGLIEESITGLDPESEPSGARIKALQQTAKADKVDTVFYETLVSDRTAKTLANDAGLRTDVLDPVEGITDKSKGDDYIQVMEANLTALRTALGAK
ncbi:metal ABC transporter substrate-binding protein [Streptomyces uncialis]|uniref:metal ABC transporter substrate-binding protein n=1 Tax=Streptomyces uncialis TaxID=1048205 RepID=UPI0038709FC2|nr:metal ABC transporter substrate-binding protein [Streptomyces uncialis]